MSAIGAFTFVLHSHLPYARLAGRWPHGEEWIHEAASETYIPLLQTLYDLKDDGVNFKLTVGITPVLAEQIADPLVLDHFEQFLDERIEAAHKDMLYFEGQAIDAGPLFRGPMPKQVVVTDSGKAEAQAATITEGIAESLTDDEEAEVVEDNTTEAENDPNTILEDGAASEDETDSEVSTEDPHLRYLAEWYKNYYEGIKDAFVNRFDRDMIGAFRKLQDEGYIEITTSAATHGYLPLLGHDSAIRGQLQTGIDSYKAMFGRAPTGIWLPECAYRPAYVTSQGEMRPASRNSSAIMALRCSSAKHTPLRVGNRWVSPQAMS